MALSRTDATRLSSSGSLVACARGMPPCVCYFRTVTRLDHRLTSEIGRRLREARERTGLTQMALSKTMRIGRTAIARIESGDRRMSADEAVRFARALGVPVSSLLGEGPGASGELRELVRAKRREIRRICARHGASRPRLFGSVARGEARPDSDVDLLVTMERDRTLFDLVALHNDLADLLGRSVDVGTEDMLKERIRERVLTEVVAL